MSASNHRFWMSWVGAAAMVAASGGLMACSDDDEDGEPQTVVVVQTNRVTGAVTTNVVVVADADDDDDAAAPAPEVEVENGAVNVAQVAGEWNGVFQSDEGQGHLDLELIQTADAVAGQFFLANGGAGQVGHATGIVLGDHLVVMLTVNGSDGWIELDGQVNATSSAYTGDWNGSFGTGTFALQK
ncbi:MAG: hypothetical protein GX548_05485 [Lentisphaerae bacterium]|nr:hypothetical protein [Lentisphaerota bacterium]